MDDCTPTSASSCAGISPAIQPENIHPTLFEYLQVIQRGDTELEESSHICTTESTSSEKMNGLASSGGAPTSSPTSLSISNVVPTGPSPSSSQPPVFQTQAGGTSWPGFETAQTLFAQGTTVQSSVDSPFDSSSAFNSIFRLQHPSISTQYPQLSDGISGMQRAPTVEPSLTPDTMSGSLGIGTVQMGDPNARDRMDFARYMADSVPGLVYDGNGLGWDTFLTGWQPQF